MNNTKTKKMSNLKFNILGQNIKLNFEEKEKDKLLILIEKIKKRLNKYDYLNGKVSDSKILIMLCLELEDKLSDSNILNKEQNSSNKNIELQDKKIKELSSEIIILKDQLSDHVSEKNILNQNTKNIIQLIDEMDSEIKKSINLINASDE